MKKILIILSVMILLTACGNNLDTQDKRNNNETTTAETATEETLEPTITFENGNLETEDFSLAISETKIIQSPMEANPGLFVTFTLTNKTKDKVLFQMILS
ncbi:DUF5067 domain-containing protein [Peribacillus sp. YIM B13472]|uniref:DUF5067 domain-containing protein n=1 Tax=Peribacillus sp. YIM B13472 TaxID=3366297 RepID=UPI00366E9709